MGCTLLEARNEISLLIQAGHGDRQAFGALVEMHHRAVIHFVHRFLGIYDSATAEDIAQDVFLAAWKAAPSFTPRASVCTWLLRITTNKCLNHQRAKRRKPTIPLLAGMEPTGANRENKADDSTNQAEFSAEMRQAVASLKPKQRAAVILRYAHDLSHAEIAEVLQTSAPAVKSLLFRAHNHLRKQLLSKQSENLKISAKPSRPSSAETYGKERRNDLPAVSTTSSARQ